MSVQFIDHQQEDVGEFRQANNQSGTSIEKLLVETDRNFFLISAENETSSETDILARPKTKTKLN